jgi:hypothetical protein
MKILRPDVRARAVIDVAGDRADGRRDGLPVDRTDARQIVVRKRAHGEGRFDEVLPLSRLHRRADDG